jgi:anaphase-promoting complex subunit 5
VCHILANLVAYCNSAEDSYDLAEDEDYDTEMSNLMDADIGSRAGLFDKYNQGYAVEGHIGESSSSLSHAQMSLHDFDDGKSETETLFLFLLRF